MNRPLKFLIVALVLILQLSAVSWFIFRYEHIVSEGVKVRFQCRAYDPIHPLIGHYLQVNVRETTVNFPNSFNEDSWRNQKGSLEVRVAPSTNGLWRVVEAAAHKNKDDSEKNGLWVKPKNAQLEYIMPWSEKKPMESYEAFEERRSKSGKQVVAIFPNQLFINENLAAGAEEVMKQHTEDAVAVYRVLNGEIILVDIEINGKSILDCAQEIAH